MPLWLQHAIEHVGPIWTAVATSAPFALFVRLVVARALKQRTARWLAEDAACERERRVAEDNEDPAHYRRLYEQERERARALEIEASALRRELRACHDTNASLGSETAAKTYELERVKAREVSLAAENVELRKAIDAGDHQAVAKKPSETRLRVIEVDDRRTDRPEPFDDIHSKPTPKPGKAPQQ